MVNVLLFLGGLAILLVSSRQVFLMFRDGSFRARGNRLIVRNAHPIMFWMNFGGLVLFGIVGVALICWQLLTFEQAAALGARPRWCGGGSRRSRAASAARQSAIISLKAFGRRGEF